MKTTESSPWTNARSRFIEAGGNTTQSFGFGRIIGQVYALLYLSPRPLSLDEIAEELEVSKASVSTTVRQLEQWSAVKQVWVKGDRKDYYEAETDFKTVLRRGLLDTARKKLETAARHIEDAETALTEASTNVNGEDRKELEAVLARIEEAKKFRNKIEALISNPLIDHLL